MGCDDLKIFKYVLKARDNQILELPLDSNILSVDEQHGKIVLYAMIDEENVEEKERVDYQIEIFGTGHSLPPDFHICADDFIGTVKLAGGNLMFHVFIRET